MNDIKEELACIKKRKCLTADEKWDPKSRGEWSARTDEKHRAVQQEKQHWSKWNANFTSRRRQAHCQEVSGIPISPQEGVKLIVKDLGAALGVEVQPSDIAAAHWVPSYTNDRLPAVVAQFHSRDLKEALLVKFWEARTKSSHLTANQVNKVFPQNRVYVNDQLSPENKQFLAKLKKRCQDIGYVFVWCREGKFCVRKAASENVHYINVSTLVDIDSLN